MATDKMIMCLILGLFIGVVGIIVAKVSWASLSSVGVLGFPLLSSWASLSSRRGLVFSSFLSSCLLVFSFPLLSLVFALLKSAPPALTSRKNCSLCWLKGRGYRQEQRRRVLKETFSFPQTVHTI